MRTGSKIEDENGVFIFYFWKLARLGLIRLCAVLAALSLLAAPIALAQDEPPGPHYRVQPGDTLYDIARKFGTTVTALQAANGLSDPSALAVGQSLLIPGYEDVGGMLITQTLQPGETLDSLSLRLGITSETLIKLNRVLNPERLYAGLSIVIPEEGDGLLAVPFGRVLPASAGPPLSLAASTGSAPWTVRLINPDLADWLLGANVAIPGEGRPLTGLAEPVLEIRLHPLPPIQGKTASIGVRLAEPAEVSGRLGDSELHFHSEGEWQYALQGIHALAEANLYPLQLTIRPATRPEIRFQQAVPVRDGAYGYDPPLFVDPASNDPETLRAEQELVQTLVTPFTPARMWEGLLSPPSTGHIVSFFGWRRSYNGSPYDSFHAGTDYSGGTGTPILAPAPGVVVFAGPLVARGNFTLIDHGWGVYSGYLHQSEILVAAGGTVTAGETIGRVGDTGRVTGPHLHWELWVNGVQVDPVEWTETVFP